MIRAALVGGLVLLVVMGCCLAQGSVDLPSPRPDSGLYPVVPDGYGEGLGEGEGWGGQQSAPAAVGPRDTGYTDSAQTAQEVYLSGSQFGILSNLIGNAGYPHRIAWRIEWLIMCQCSMLFVQVVMLWRMK